MRDLDIRLLRHFVAVAEELHFTRAAQRLFLAQQALSRDVRRLEERLGTPLLVRSTRRVELTAAGRRLLPRARELVALNDATVREVRGQDRPLVVDVVGPGLTPGLVLDEARRTAPDAEFFPRFHTGTESTLAKAATGEVDVTFGRALEVPDGLRYRTVRHEPVAVLVPGHHRFAELDAVPLDLMRGPDRPCVRSGDHVTPGWEHAMRQLLGPDQIEPDDFHPHVQGPEELARHVRDRDAPILTLTTQPDVPGAVLRPLSEPVVLFPWAMVQRAGAGGPGLDALDRAAATLASEHGWLDVPPGAWLPAPEAGR